jgi:hypothetical protein
MKLKVLAIAVVMALFAGVSRADSACQAGGMGSLVGTSCIIGNTDFTFLNNYSESDTSILSSLTFTPESTATSAGFNISGLPGTSSTGQLQLAYLQAFSFTAVPMNGTITSFTAVVNGIHQDTNTYQVSFADLYNSINSNNSYDQYISGAESPRPTGGPEASFNGFFSLENYSYNGGSTSFDSADFVFNESDPGPTSVPEGSELAFMGLGIVAILGAMKKKFLVAR